MDIRKMTDEELAGKLYLLYEPDFPHWEDLSDNYHKIWMYIAKFIRQCIKDSQPEGLSVEEIRNILYADDTIDPIPPYRCLPPVDKTTANVKALAIHAAQERKGKDKDVA